MNPLDFIIQGGQGGVTIAPSATATAGRFSNSVTFAPTGGGISTLQLGVVGVLVLGGLFIIKKVS